MNEGNVKIVAQYTDRYGETQVIHKTRHGLKRKRRALTPFLQLNQPIGKLVGAKIKAKREERGWTLVEMARRVGIESGHPKQRIWEIENAVRNQAMRIGTLYAFAIVFDCPIDELLPTRDEVAQLAGIEHRRTPRLDVAV